MIVGKDACALCELARQMDHDEPVPTLAMAVVIGVAVGSSDESDIGLCDDCQTCLELAVETHNEADTGESPASEKGEG